VANLAKREKLLASAQKYLQKGQVAKAIKDYQKLVQADPRDVRNRQKLAELLGRDKKVAEALEEYEAVARHYADSGFYLKAIAVYKQMQKLDPARVDIYHRLAELNEKQGLVGNALAEYRNLVAHFEKQGNVSEAIEVLRKMRELEPENLNILVKIAETHARAGGQEKAREEFDVAHAILREKGDQGRILKLHEMFLAICPDDLRIKTGLAKALIEKDETEKGLQLLQSLLQDRPEDDEVLRALVLGYRKAEQFENERLACQHLLRNTPGDLELREAYIHASLNGGEHRRALQELEEWKDAFLDAGRVSLLRDLYQELREGLPGDESVASALRTIYEIIGEEDKTPRALSPQVEDEAISGAGEGSGDEEIAEEDLLREKTSPGAEVPVASDEPESPDEAGAAGGDAEEVEGAEEIPLEFLEAVAPEGSLVEASAPGEEEPIAEDSATAEESLSEEAPVEEEVELELELDIDFDEVGQFEPEREEEFSEEGPSLASGRNEDVRSAAVSPLEEGVVEEVLELEEIEPLGEELPGVNIRAEMEEAEFYLQQGLLEDAERVCRNLIEVDPRCEEARRKLDEIEDRRQEGSEKSPASEGLFDLGAEIGEEGFPDLEENEVDFADSQKGIKTQIDSEDTESHYNLGIAYKEMGLMDDAVAEFDRAMKNPERAIDCLTLKGLCLADSGSLDEAEKAFRAAMEHERASDEERVSINYELGLLYERKERFSDALDCFQYVADTDIFHREVGEKIEALRRKLGLKEGNGDGQAGGKGSKDRVSYV